MAEQEVKVIIKAEDKATAELKKVNASFLNASKTMQGGLKALRGAATAAGVGIAALGTATVAFGVSSIKSFMEAEAQTAKFNAMMKTTGKGAEEAAKKIQDVADKALDLGFDNEAAAMSLGKFYTATKSVEEATRLNNIAMDIARAKNVDLESAQKMVNMTLAGATRELKAMGIEVDENATGVDNLRKVEELYAGQAAAYAQTSAGKIAILNERYGELKETIGSTLSEALTPFLDKLLEFTKSEEGQKQLEALNTSIRENLPRAIAIAKPILEGLWKTIKTIGAAIEFVIVKAQQFGAYLGTASVKAEDAWAGFVASIEKTYKKVIGWFDSVIASFKKITSLKFSFSGSSKKDEGDDNDKRATGGSVMPGKSYLVGENGPELFIPNQNGSIDNRPNTSQSITINLGGVSVRNDNDIRTLVDMLKKELNRDGELTRIGAF